MPSDLPLRLPGNPGNSQMLQRRLHPLTLVFSLLRLVRSGAALLPLIVLGRWIGILALIIVSLLSVAYVIARYLLFHYRIENGELITTEGVLKRTVRHIPLERVQEIRIEQGIVHRLFDVVDAVVETAGGGGPEASLSVLARHEAETLRAAVFARNAPHPLAAASDTNEIVIARLSLVDLIRAGATTNHLLTGLVILGALNSIFNELVPDSIYEYMVDTISGAAGQLFERDVISMLMLSVAGLVVILVAGALFSIVGSVVLFYGFTVTRQGEDLHRSYGLFTQRASSLPRRRIQVLEIEESWLRRIFKLTALRADTVSAPSEEGGEKRKGRDVLIPVVARAKVQGLLPVFFPDFPAEQLQWQRVSRLAVRRGTMKGALVCALAALILCLYGQTLGGLWPLLLLPVVYVMVARKYQGAGYALGQRYFITRRGWPGRSTHIVPIGKTQAVEVRQTLFDRRLGLATLVVDTAGQAYTGGGPKVSNLPVAEAYRLARELSARAALIRYKS